MNYDKLRKQLDLLGFTKHYINLIIEAVSIDNELRQSIEEVQGESERNGMETDNEV